MGLSKELKNIFGLDRKFGVVHQRYMARVGKRLNDDDWESETSCEFFAIAGLDHKNLLISSVIQSYSDPRVNGQWGKVLDMNGELKEKYDSAFQNIRNLMSRDGGSVRRHTRSYRGGRPRPYPDPARHRDYRKEVTIDILRRCVVANGFVIDEEGGTYKVCVEWDARAECGPNFTHAWLEFGELIIQKVTGSPIIVSKRVANGVTEENTLCVTVERLLEGQKKEIMAVLKSPHRARVGGRTPNSEGWMTMGE